MADNGPLAMETCGCERTSWGAGASGLISAWVIGARLVDSNGTFSFGPGFRADLSFMNWCSEPG
jgi:hypothetical protein